MNRGYDSNRVCSLSKFHSYCVEISTLSMGTSPITPCYDAEVLQTKTQVGLGPGESIEYTKHRVSLEGHLWPGCHPEVTPAVHIVMDRPSKRGAWTMLVKWTPKDCYLSRKDYGLQGRDIQVVKTCKGGWRGPASRLRNVWNGHPTRPCPRREDASGGMGSVSDGALQPGGGVC